MGIGPCFLFNSDDRGGDAVVAGPSRYPNILFDLGEVEIRGGGGFSWLCTPRSKSRGAMPQGQPLGREGKREVTPG